MRLTAIWVVLSILFLSCARGDSSNLCVSLPGDHQTTAVLNGSQENSGKMFEKTVNIFDRCGAYEQRGLLQARGPQAVEGLAFSSEGPDWLTVTVTQQQEEDLCVTNGVSLLSDEPANVWVSPAGDRAYVLQSNTLQIFEISDLGSALQPMQNVTFPNEPKTLVFSKRHDRIFLLFYLYYNPGTQNHRYSVASYSTNGDAPNVLSTITSVILDVRDRNTFLENPLPFLALSCDERYLFGGNSVLAVSNEGVLSDPTHILSPTALQVAENNDTEGVVDVLMDCDANVFHRVSYNPSRRAAAELLLVSGQVTGSGSGSQKWSDLIQPIQLDMHYTQIGEVVGTKIVALQPRSEENLRSYVCVLLQTKIYVWLLRVGENGAITRLVDVSVENGIRNMSSSLNHSGFLGPLLLQASDSSLWFWDNGGGSLVKLHLETHLSAVVTTVYDLREEEGAVPTPKQQGLALISRAQGTALSTALLIAPQSLSRLIVLQAIKMPVLYIAGSVLTLTNEAHAYAYGINATCSSGGEPVRAKVDFLVRPVFPFKCANDATPTQDQNRTFYCDCNTARPQRATSNSSIFTDSNMTGWHGTRCDCPLFAECVLTGNDALINITAHAGYFWDEDTASVVRCVPEEACDTQEPQGCGAGYDGERSRGCPLCEFGFFRSFDVRVGVCTVCPETDGLKIALAVGMAAGAVVGVMWIRRKFGMYFKFIGMAVYFLQLVSVLVSTAAPEWLYSFVHTFAFLSLRMDFMGRIECYVKGMSVGAVLIIQYTLAMLVPVVLVGSQYAVTRVQLLLLERDASVAPQERAKQAQSLRHGFSNSIPFFLSFVHFPLISIIDDVFVCSESNRLAVQPQMLCAGAEYSVLVFLAVLCGCVWGLGIPGYFIWAIARRPRMDVVVYRTPLELVYNNMIAGVERLVLELTCRKQSRRKLVYDLSEREEYEGAMIAFYKRFGVIAVHYRHHMVFWEVVLMAFKIFMTGLTVVAQSDLRARGTVSLCVLAVAMYYSVKYSPYVDVNVNRLEGLSMGVLILLALFEGFVYSSMSSSSSLAYVISVFFIICITSVLVLILIAAHASTRARARVPEEVRVLRLLYPEYSFLYPSQHTLRVAEREIAGRTKNKQQDLKPTLDKQTRVKHVTCPETVCIDREPSMEDSARTHTDEGIDVEAVECIPALVAGEMANVDCTMPMDLVVPQKTATGAASWCKEHMHGRLLGRGFGPLKELPLASLSAQHCISSTTAFEERLFACSHMKKLAKMPVMTVPARRAFLRDFICTHPCPLPSLTTLDWVTLCMQLGTVARLDAGISKRHLVPLACLSGVFWACVAAALGDASTWQGLLTVGLVSTLLPAALVVGVIKALSTSTKKLLGAVGRSACQLIQHSIPGLRIKVSGIAFDWRMAAHFFKTVSRAHGLFSLGGVAVSDMSDGTLDYLIAAWWDIAESPRPLFLTFTGMWADSKTEKKTETGVPHQWRSSSIRPLLLRYQSSGKACTPTLRSHVCEKCSAGAAIVCDTIKSGRLLRCALCGTVSTIFTKRAQLKRMQVIERMKLESKRRQKERQLTEAKVQNQEGHRRSELEDSDKDPERPAHADDVIGSSASEKEEVWTHPRMKRLPGAVVLTLDSDLATEHMVAKKKPVQHSRRSTMLLVKEFCQAADVSFSSSGESSVEDSSSSSEVV